MDRVAVFIDAGYLFAQGSALLGKSGKRPRGEVILDHQQAIGFFQSFAERVSGVRLLRVYWYDGTRVGPTPQHSTLAYLDNVKVRLGFINSVGEQKGVDSLIVTDMITLARNRSMADAVLLSGDEDLRVGVQQAQEFGVRVHLAGIKPSQGSQSIFLLQEADTTYEMNETEVGSFLSLKTAPSDLTSEVSRVIAAGATSAAPPQGPAADAPPSIEPFDGVATDLASSLQLSEIPTLISLVETTRQMPREVDARLLAGARRIIGRDLDPREKKSIRGLLILRLRARLAL